MLLSPSVRIYEDICDKIFHYDFMAYLKRFLFKMAYYNGIPELATTFNTKSEKNNYGS